MKAINLAVYKTIAFLTLLTILPQPADAASDPPTLTVGGIVYSLDRYEMTCAVSRVTSDLPTVVTIPERVDATVNSYTVTSIARGAFSRNKTITSVTMPNSIVSIPEECFYLCSNLTEVKLSNAITVIPGSTFQGCGKLASVIIPEGVTELKGYVFCQTGHLAFLELPSTLRSIGNRCFEEVGNHTANGCTIICHATVPPAVTANTFDPSTIKIKEIAVHKGLINAYETADGWKNFIGKFRIATPETITLDPTALDVNVGEEFVITADVQPEMRDNDYLHWEIPTSIVKAITDNSLPKNQKKFKAIVQGSGNIECSVTNFTEGIITDTSTCRLTVNPKSEEGHVALYVALEHGTVGFCNAAKSDTKLIFTAADGWTVNNVTIDGEDITQFIASDGTYTVAALGTVSKTVTVVYRENLNTSIDTNPISANPTIKIIARHGNIRIEGATEGAVVSLYDLNGRLLHRTREHDFSTTATGVLILNVDNQRYKLIL